MNLLILAYTAFTVKIALCGTELGKHHCPQYFSEMELGSIYTYTLNKL